MSEPLSRCEQALIGSILLDPAVLSRVAPIVSADDFQDTALGELFAAVATLSEARKPVSDTVWLCRQLRAMKVPEDVCSPAALRKFAETAVHAGHAVYYAEQVAKAAGIRRLAIIAVEMRSRTNDPAADPAEIRDWLESKLAGLDSNQSHEARLVGDVATDLLNEIEAAADCDRKPGTFTGLSSLDSVAGPMMPGELVIVAARPGEGKTALGAQVGVWNAERGRNVLFASLEMRDTEIVRRLLCSRAGLDSRDVRSGHISQPQRQQLADASQTVRALPCRLWSPPSATMATVRAAARYVKATSGLDLLIVDYIGRIHAAGEYRRLPRWEQVSKISGSLKTLAKELDVPVIALCQLNRDAEKAEPKLSQLRESGSIEQDADVVLFIHHHDAECDLIIGKHRHGEVGKVSVFWIPQETRFDCVREFRP